MVAETGSAAEKVGAPWAERVEVAAMTEEVVAEAEEEDPELLLIPATRWAKPDATGPIPERTACWNAPLGK